MTTTANQPRTLACARCGAAFDCDLNGECWCAAEPYRLPMTKALLEDCLCPACLRKAAADACHRPVTDGGPTRKT
jgi:hypothetical protein